ncbi:MAG: LexA family transcriptional regulator [Prolixibacteraceae bacterium]|jgi:transcriptional regulator with XRE-family HTH domain|nr:LexA family transcriptional regulator [Prolixibacteraceae bacterium]
MIHLQENIRLLRKQREWTQGQLAEKLGIKRSLIGAYEEGRAVPKLLVIQQLSLLFGLSIDRLLTVNLSNEKVIPGTDVRVLSTVVDTQNEERICIVPVKASAGYLNGLTDPEYVAELPHFALPVRELSQGNSYRVFQIKGDSMLPVPSGAYIFCSYVESLDGIRDGKPYIVLTADEGVLYKRVFNRNEEDGTLLMKSDNEAYEPYSVAADQVLEVWQSIGFLTFDLPEPSTMDMNKISSMLFKMQEEIKNLKEQ